MQLNVFKPIVFIRRLLKKYYQLTFPCLHKGKSRSKRTLFIFSINSNTLNKQELQNSVTLEKKKSKTCAKNAIVNQMNNRLEWLFNIDAVNRTYPPGQNKRKNFKGKLLQIRAHAIYARKHGVPHYFATQN